MEHIFELTPIPTLVISPQNTVLAISRGFCSDVTTLNPIDFRHLPLDILLNEIPFIKATQLQEEVDRAIKTRKVCVLEPVTPDETRFWEIRITPIFAEPDDQNKDKRKKENNDNHITNHTSSSPSTSQDSLLYIIIEFNNATPHETQIKDLREKLRDSEVYRLLVDTVKDYAIFLLDSTGHIETWNTGARLLKQYTAAEIIGKHFSTFYSQEDKDAKIPELELKVAVKEGKFEDSGWRYRKDGSKFWANVVITPSYREGKLVGFTKITRDLTERHAAEARLVAEYEEASKLKSQFLANMSHEIRSPMHGMLSAITLLSETGLNSEQKELAGIIEDSGSILLQVINDILDYSKLSSGVFQMNHNVDMSIKDTVKAVIKSIETGLNKADSDLELWCTLDERLPSLVQGDPLRFRQVLQNILINAVKFTEHGSVEIVVKVVNDYGERVEILTEVIDTGVGVSPNLTNLLFTPFTQLDNSLTKKFKGTGLGLSICKSLVELMGGRIGFRHNPTGQGSIFWFSVVVTKSRSKEIPSISSKTLQTMTTNTGKPILLVEDNPVNQKVMVKTLEKLGFKNIDVADDGRQAVDKFTERPYALVLMDISMPVLSGIEATQEIRQMNEKGKNVPIIAMTANALKGDSERFIQAGLSDYIAKPVDRRLLVRLLAKWLA